MKIKPWFSTDVEQGVESVHHDNTSCMDGSNIEKNHRRYGTDNRPLANSVSGLMRQGGSLSA
jgi:hypothetical protein